MRILYRNLKIAALFSVHFFEMKYIALLIAVTLTTIASAQFAIIDMNGDQREGSIEAITPETATDLQRIVPLAVPESAFPAAVTVLELRDGSRIVASDVRMTAPMVAFHNSRTEPMQIPLDQVAALRFEVGREQ